MNDNTASSRSVDMLPSDWDVVRLARSLREHLPELRDRYGVASLELFGSYVRNEQKPESDLDVLVEFQRSVGLFDFVSLQQDLSDLLGVRVDLVMRSALRPPVEPFILSEAAAV
jgi:predicted nucleotidyltransferase